LFDQSLGGESQRGEETLPAGKSETRKIMNNHRLFETRANRRSVVAAAAIGAATVGFGRMTAAQTPSAFESGGLGLTRAQFEETFGPGELVEMPGHPIYDSTYSYGTQLGMVYAWYLDMNGESYVSYIEIDFASDKLDASEARQRAESLMPTDATFSELYIAPSTPSGPVAIEMTRYVSESLGKVHEGTFPPEIVVMIQQPWNDSTTGTPASGISIMTRMVTQSG
jgi:hypothetical protein